MKWLPDVVCDNISNLYDCKEFRDGKATGSPNRFIKRNQELIDDELRDVPRCPLPDRPATA